ncbi:MAG: hypothetical protein HC904_10370 [Blastochloris sp.]|nr:hypothetical protein [Blastochloris sp.]
MENSKKQEMATYSKLGLYRSSKSKRRRSAVEDKGLEIFIGDNRTGRPWVKVLRAHYDEAWTQALERLRSARVRPT